MKILDNMNYPLGSVDENGTILDNMNYPKGRIGADGTIMDNMNYPKGRIAADGAIMDNMNYPKGRIDANGTIMDNLNYPKGRLDGFNEKPPAVSGSIRGITKLPDLNRGNRTDMEANVIKAQIDEAWRDASASWKDEYATRYKTAVISELESTLDHLQKTSNQLNEAIDTVLSSLREFD
jgi:hypothetical protein